MSDTNDDTIIIQPKKKVKHKHKRQDKSINDTTDANDSNNITLLNNNTTINNQPQTPTVQATNIVNEIDSTNLQHSNNNTTFTTHTPYIDSDDDIDVVRRPRHDSDDNADQSNNYDINNTTRTNGYVDSDNDLDNLPRRPQQHHDGDSNDNDHIINNNYTQQQSHQFDDIMSGNDQIEHKSKKHKKHKKHKHIDNDDICSNSNQQHQFSLPYADATDNISQTQLQSVPCQPTERPYYTGTPWLNRYNIKPGYRYVIVIIIDK